MRAKDHAERSLAEAAQDGLQERPTAAAPVLILFFNRPTLLRELLRRVVAAAPPRVYLACDGPRAQVPGEAEVVEACRAASLDAGWACEVRTRFLPVNAGCARAVSGAISWFFEHEPEGIILEDDCHPSPDFFPFASELLARYRHDERVMSINGTNFFPSTAEPAGSASYRFSKAPSVWGWASWARAWQHHRLGVSDEEIRSLCRSDLPCDAPASLRGWRNRLRSCGGDAPHTWDYQWSYAHFRHRGLAIVPSRNLVTNVPGEPGTHMRGTSPWQGIPADSLAFPLVHPEGVAADAKADRTIERVHCNHRPWLARKLWQLATRHGLMTADDVRNGFDATRFLERLHATLAAAWLCALGIGAAPESILFTCLCAVTAVRAPTIMRRQVHGPAALPLAIWAAFVGWMALSISWSDTSLALADALPGRWYLGPLLVLPARLPTRVILWATAIPGAWWTMILALAACGVPLPSLVLPGHPSVTFAGIGMLAIAGMAAASAAPNRRGRAIGWLGLTAALAGAALSMSRGLTIAIVGTAAMISGVTAEGRRRAFRCLAAIAAIAIAMLAAAWQAGIGDKFAVSVATARSSLTHDHVPAAERFTAAINAVAANRPSLHSWTSARVPEAWLQGRGAKSWADDFAEDFIASPAPNQERSAFSALAGQRFFAHQLYLQTAYEYGAIGVAMLVAFGASCWLAAWPTRRTVASAAVLSFTALVGILGLTELQPNDRANAHLAVVLLALVAQVDRDQRTRSARPLRTLALATAAGVAVAAVIIAASAAVRSLLAPQRETIVAVRDDRFRVSGNLIPDSGRFPGAPWVPLASGRGIAPTITGTEVRFDAGGTPSEVDGSFLELAMPGLPAGTTTFSFRVKGPENAFIAARGTAGAGMSRIPLDGRWQRVHLTEQTSPTGEARLRIGLVAGSAGEAALPQALAVEVRDPQLVVGRGRAEYQATSGPGASPWPVRWTAGHDDAPAAENHVRWSGRLDLPPWQRLGLADVARCPVDPSGGTDGWILVEDSSDGWHGISQPFRCTSAGEWTATVCVAPQARRACRLELELPGGRTDAAFDLAEARVSGSSGAGTVDAEIVRLDDRWQRITLRGRATTDGPASVRLLALESDATNVTHAGNGRGALAVWGTVVEPGRGSGVYVPTAFRARSFAPAETTPDSSR
jgi:hypothetical protein